ncbi:EamA family transporter [Paenibacillus kobensis]|uniref:EamA family transporter n=1 Tax=Paenibacillus kobensis TaxID=59841 RepID=UPI000FD818D7|nr:EamA family transporter [Paenibacillus kobensis]
MTNSTDMLLLVLMTLFGSAGGALLKLFSSTRKLKWAAFGLAAYGAGALLNIYLLSVLPYTLVVPANALTFVWAMVLAKWIFGEQIKGLRWAGVAFIMGGLILLTMN